MFKHLCISLMFLAAGAVLATPVAQSDLDKFQGTWHLVAQNEGRKLLGTLKIVHSTYEYRVDSYVEVGTIHLDAARDPKQIDLTVTKGSNKTKTTRGIYKLDGSGLSLCLAKMGDNRPSTFKDDPGSSVIWWSGNK